MSLKTHRPLIGLISLAALTLVTACAPSPFWVSRARGTQGEIPRDERGEPLWAAIPPAPPAPQPGPPMPTHVGPPIVVYPNN